MGLFSKANAVETKSSVLPSERISALDKFHIQHVRGARDTRIIGTHQHFERQRDDVTAEERTWIECCRDGRAP